MNKFQMVNPQIADYVMNSSIRLNDYQRRLFEKTQNTKGSHMLGSLDMVQHFQLILKAIGAKRCIEIGTYTGYTTLSIAQVLPDGGEIITCDVFADYVAFDVWREAKVDDKIKFRLGCGIKTMDELIADGQEGTFDFAFIDADKTKNKEYYERCLKLLRVGGIICIDNVCWKGLVVDAETSDETTKSIQEFTRFVKDDDRVDISMLTIGDGALFCIKK